MYVPNGQRVFSSCCRCDVADAVFAAVRSRFAAAVYLILSLGVAILSLDVDLEDIPLWCRSKGEVVPVPPGLVSGLHRLPERRLSRSERARFQSDGVALVRNALPSEAVLAALRNATRRSCDEHWHLNGALRSLLRDGPLGALAGTAIGAISPSGACTACVAETVVFNQNAADGVPGERGGAHIDVDFAPATLEPMVTVWLALTHAPHALEFLSGSHRALKVTGCEDDTDIDESSPCWAALHANFSWRSWRMRPGDALVFNAQVWHRSVTVANERSALAMRFVAADARFEVRGVIDTGNGHIGQ
jgi:hypothetical protein